MKRSMVLIQLDKMNEDFLPVERKVLAETSAAYMQALTAYHDCDHDDDGAAVASYKREVELREGIYHKAQELIALRLIELEGERQRELYKANRVVSGVLPFPRHMPDMFCVRGLTIEDVL